MSVCRKGGYILIVEALRGAENNRRLSTFYSIILFSFNSDIWYFAYDFVSIKRVFFVMKHFQKCVSFQAIKEYILKYDITKILAEFVIDVQTLFVLWVLQKFQRQPHNNQKSIFQSGSYRLYTHIHAMRPGFESGTCCIVGGRSYNWAISPLSTKFADFQYQALKDNFLSCL